MAGCSSNSPRSWAPTCPSLPGLKSSFCFSLHLRKGLDVLTSGNTRFCSRLTAVWQPRATRQGLAHSRQVPGLEPGRRGVSRKLSCSRGHAAANQDGVSPALPTLQTGPVTALPAPLQMLENDRRWHPGQQPFLPPWPRSPLHSRDLFPTRTTS